MLKTALLTLLCLTIALVGGAGSVWLALDAPQGIGSVSVGGWTAFADQGAAGGDPYSSARASRQGTLSLGRAEGLAFVAERDSGGDLLLRDCAYTIEGAMPAARLWTLYAADPDLTVLPVDAGRAAALHSRAMLFLPGSALSIAASRRAQPGNWLALSGTGRLALVLTLYDTPISGGADIADIDMPQILKVGCDA